MCKEIFQLFSYRFKAWGGLSALFLLFLPAMAFAQTDNIVSVTAFPANPVPGGTVAVTVIYCPNKTYNNSFFEVGLEPSSVTAFPGTCPVPGQIILVDSHN